MLKLVSIVAVVASTAGCVAGLFSRNAGFDARPVSIQTVSFFNQRTPSRLAKRPWKGDWILRRDRLEMVDRALRNFKPDILVLQEVMERQGSLSESDLRILKAGVLAEYEWRQEPVARYEDTQETESLALAVALPMRFFSPKEPGRDEREMWPLGEGGFLMAATVDFEDQPITVFNVQLPPKDGTEWLSFVRDRAFERLTRNHHCPKRVIVAGLIPGDEESADFRELLDSLQLKDASTGFCQIASRCFTATPINDLFLATVGDESPSRVDRIFLNRAAFVTTSVRNFEEADAANRYVREFGLQRLWATQRFGWATSARLPRCTPDELL